MTHVKVGVTPDVHRWRCFLDGVDVSNDAFEADDEAGWVKRYARDEGGRYVVAHGLSRQVATETVHGAVRLEFV